jgi:hypothetical protein
LNVIAMLLTTDDFTFIPKRSEMVFERSNTWQASVGGAVECGDRSPAEALTREIYEEWGIATPLEHVRFLALGRNRQTAEPDLLALVRPGISASELITTFRDRGPGLEFCEFDCIQVTSTNISSLCSLLRSKEWSQPSDQAAFLLMLIEQFGHDQVATAL